MLPVVLRTERLVLSAPVDDDIDAITELCQDELMRDALASLPWPYLRGHAESFVREIVAPGWARGDGLVWGIRERQDGPLRGSIGWRAERGDIGFWMGAPSRGRGYMTEAVRAVCAWLFAELGVERIGWEAVAGNVASAKVARASGFRYDGEGPIDMPFRDGSHPHGWHGHMRATDDGSRQAGWPI